MEREHYWQETHTSDNDYKVVAYLNDLEEACSFKLLYRDIPVFSDVYGRNHSLLYRCDLARIAKELIKDYHARLLRELEDSTDEIIDGPDAWPDVIDQLEAMHTELLDLPANVDCVTSLHKRLAEIVLWAQRYNIADAQS